MASDLEELGQYFEQKCANVSQILELRGIEDTEGATKALQAINNEVGEVEEMMNDFKKYLMQQQKLLKNAEALKDVFDGFQQRNEHIAANLPQHLPGRQSSGPARTVLKERDQAVSAESEKKAKVKPAAKTANYHKIDYLTTEQFDSVPKYLKGRLTYAQVNSAVDQIHQVLAAKYKILNTKRLGMGEHIMKKYREFKEQEMAETKGCYFFVDKDLKEFSSFKLDKVGQSILNILRHCGKLKEIYPVSQNIATLISADTKIIIKSIKRYEANLNKKKDICLAAYGNIVSEIQDVVSAFNMPEKFHIECPKGFLLLGPPGVGKSSLVVHLAECWDAELFVLNGADVFGAHMGESEKNLRKIFETARETSKHIACVLFIDEVDALCPKRSEGSDVENRVASQLLTLIDEIMSQSSVILIAATNRPNSLDPAVRRPGRFDKEFVIGVPSYEQRLEVLKTLTCNLPLSPDVDLEILAKQCLGYVAADLAALVRQSTMNALTTTLNNSDTERNIGITMSDLQKSFNAIIPSTYRGVDGIVECTPVKWQDIAGYDNVKQVLRQAVEWPFLYPESFSRLGLSLPRGILLYGPPGCCKTTLVRAAATSCHCTFLSLSCAQLYSPYVGDAERMIREVFTKARAAAPSILFLDEVDAVVRKRSTDGSSGVEARILSTLLNEIDGVGISSNVYETTNSNVSSEQKNILFVAATNRPEVLDEAILRPGRVDRVVYVPHPDRETRLEILKLCCKNMPTADDVCPQMIADKTELYSGADLKNLCREAALNALQDLGIEKCSHVEHKHFIQALSAISPSLSREQVKSYENLALSL